MTTYNEAEDAILGLLKTQWDANAPALNSGVLPQLVYEFIEPDLKPHPRDTSKPWARVVLRNTDAVKATMSNSAGLARYRRLGMVWVQVFVPARDGSAWTKAQQLASVAQRAYEGKRAAGTVVFTKAAIVDQPRDGAWVRKDVKAFFYWDEIH